MPRAKYLLPCSCGREIPVEMTQAGQQIACDCGAQLEVPTMQGLRRLKLAETAPTVRPTGGSWAARQQLVLLGAVVVCGALVWAMYLYLHRPRLIETDDLTVSQTWVLWHNLRAGVGHRTGDFMGFVYGVRVYWRWMGVAGAIAAAGGLIMASSLLVPRRTRSPRAEEVDSATSAQ